MEKVVKKNGQVLSTDKTTKKSELEKLNQYLKSLQKKQHLCFDCGTDIADCIKIMDEKERLDETSKYDFITEAYQKVDPRNNSIQAFTVVKCDDYKEPKEAVKKGPTNEQKKQLEIAYVNHKMGDKEGTNYAITFEEAEKILDRENEIAGVATFRTKK